MKCTIPEISWHNRDPVLSVDIQPNAINDTYRLASGGTDSHVLIWILTVERSGVASIECAADLTRHTKPVNCVRFSPSGHLLASGDDESCIILWKMKTSNDPVEFPSGEEDTFKEQWISVKVLRGHLQDVYDLSWSADSKNLISGSVDNTAILWEVPSGKNLGILGEHKGFVQGVTWDPCGQYVATISSDRVCRIYNAATRKVVTRLYKGILPGVEAETKPTHFFHDDTLKSFFRRLTFTPDGELLIIPSGLVEEPEKKSSNATMIFARNCLSKPAVYLPSLSQYTVAVRCCPVLFTLRQMQSPPLFDLPYRVVIAVATQCSVLLYDTQHAAPFAFITKIHYTRLTDLTWSSDGRVLVVSSTDGYCSVITFAENELGTVYRKDTSTEDKQTDDIKTSESSCHDKPNKNIPMEVSGEEQLPEVTVKSANLEQTEAAKTATSVSDNKNEKSTDPMAKEEITKTVVTRVNQSEVEKEAKKSATPVNQPDKYVPSKSTVIEEMAMEVDDFQLVYEGTVADPVLEKKDLPSAQCGNIETSPKKEGKLEETQVSTPERPLVSPAKTSDTTNVQPEGFASPTSTSTKNVMPGSSNKKTPRRVQLITLSSPKSKKKLLE